jgi:hypothetical protein
VFDDPFEQGRPAAITDAILALSTLCVGGDSPGWTSSPGSSIDGVLAVTDPVLLLGGPFPWGSDPSPPDPSSLKGNHAAVDRDACRTSCGARL